MAIIIILFIFALIVGFFMVKFIVKNLLKSYNSEMKFTEPYIRIINKYKFQKVFEKYSPKTEQIFKEKQKGLTYFSNLFRLRLVGLNTMYGFSNYIQGVINNDPVTMYEMKGYNKAYGTGDTTGRNSTIDVIEIELPKNNLKTDKNNDLKIYYDDNLKSLMTQIASEAPIKLFEISDLEMQLLFNKYNFNTNPLKLKDILKFTHFIIRYNSDKLFIFREKQGYLTQPGADFNQLDDLLKIGLYISKIIAVK